MSQSKRAGMQQGSQRTQFLNLRSLASHLRARQRKFRRKTTCLNRKLIFSLLNQMLRMMQKKQKTSNHLRRGFTRRKELRTTLSKVMSRDLRVLTQRASFKLNNLRLVVQALCPNVSRTRLTTRQDKMSKICLITSRATLAVSNTKYNIKRASDCL